MIPININISKLEPQLAASNSSAPPALNVDDSGIKLKARGHVAGRDILNKKPAVLPASKFN